MREVRAPAPSSRRPVRRSAFTLIELVSVLAIVVVLLAIALGSYYGWTRAAGIDTAANLTATVCTQARELAITQLIRAEVTCSNLTPVGRAPCGVLAVYTFDTNDTPILAMPANQLPSGICFRFTNLTEQAVVFLPDGTASAPENHATRIVVVSQAGDSGHTLARIVEVNPVTGRPRVLPRGTAP